MNNLSSGEVFGEMEEYKHAYEMMEAVWGSGERERILYDDTLIRIGRGYVDRYFSFT